MSEVIKSDSLEFLKQLKDYQADIVFADPPYALGSEIIGGLKANFQNWYACEINQDYVDIANARIAHYKEYEYVQLKLF